MILQFRWLRTGLIEVQRCFGKQQLVLFSCFRLSICNTKHSSYEVWLYTWIAATVFLVFFVSNVIWTSFFISFWLNVAVSIAFWFSKQRWYIVPDSGFTRGSENQWPYLIFECTDSIKVSMLLDCWIKSSLLSPSLGNYNDLPFEMNKLPCMKLLATVQQWNSDHHLQSYRNKI